MQTCTQFQDAMLVITLFFQSCNNFKHSQTLFFSLVQFTFIPVLIVPKLTFPPCPNNTHTNHTNMSIKLYPIYHSKNLRHKFVIFVNDFLVVRIQILRTFNIFLIKGFNLGFFVIQMVGIFFFIKRESEDGLTCTIAT